MSSSYKNIQLFATVSLLSLTTITGAFLLSSNTYADGDNEVIDTVSLEVPVACTLSGTGMNSHNANIINGNYQANIGTTVLHAFCNDASGFAIYAAGYTGDEIGATNSNKLVGTNASGNATIDTGLATSAGNPDVSNWAMKLAISQDSGDTAGTNAFTIDSAPNVPNGADASFSQYHTVPNKYVKVAHKDAATDMTTSTGGVKLTTTYAAYIAANQPADSYSGQVIYTLVHPSDHATPIANPATLDTGRTVNTKLKSLAATVVNGEETTINQSFAYYGDSEEANDRYIKSISIHLETPAPTGFVPSEKNTVSTSTSKKPIYAVFDNTNDAGIMHFYTEGEQIILSPDSSFMFYSLRILSEISGIADWDTSNVTDMGAMFYRAGYDTDSFAVGLSSWDTSHVTNMSHMFGWTGYSAITFTLDLSSWDTSNVQDMSFMFQDVGFSARSWSISGLSVWDTSNVTNMSYMFEGAGHSTADWNIGDDISSWNTSNVTNMVYMFDGAANFANTFSMDLSSWDTSKVTNMGSMFNDTASQVATTYALDLSSWDTASVTNMSYMFGDSGKKATTWSIEGLSSWNTANVTNMGGMFTRAGYSASRFKIDLSSWNTSKVTSMNNIFSDAGYKASNWSVTIPQTNGNSINNTTSRMYGKNTSTYGTPRSGKSFTLAQP